MLPNEKDFPVSDFPAQLELVSTVSPFPSSAIFAFSSGVGYCGVSILTGAMVDSKEVDVEGI